MIEVTVTTVVLLVFGGFIIGWILGKLSANMFVENRLVNFKKEVLTDVDLFITKGQNQQLQQMIMQSQNSQTPQNEMDILQQEIQKLNTTAGKQQINKKDKPVYVG